MLVSSDKNSLYSKITNKKYSTAREYLSSTYGEPKVRYYNAYTKKEKHEIKRLKTKHIALIVAALTVLIGIISAISAKNNNGNFAGLANKITNLMSNFNNIKDDYWNKISDKLSEIKIFSANPFSFFKKGGEKITEFYKKTVKSSFAEEWDKNADALLKAAKKENIDLNIDKFDKWYNNLSDNIFVNLHEKNNRITDNLINKNVISKLTQSNIADEKIHDIALDAARKIEIPSNASKKLVQKINEFNSYKAKTASIIVPKLRDINLGSGPTDVLNQAIAFLSLVTVILSANSKEEKESTAINLGIPLLTALATTTIATLKALSGATALAFGLITGECASIAANALSKLVKKHSTKSDI